MNLTLNPNILTIPVALPMFTAALMLLTSRVLKSHAVRVQRWLALPAFTANLVIALLLLFYTTDGHRLVYQLGLWPAPFGITIMADGLTAIMLTMVALLCFVMLPFAVGTLDLHRESVGYYPLSLLLLMGVNGAFLAGDFFNLYVFFEVLLTTSFVLITLGGAPGQINGGIRYVILNLMASTMFLTAAGLTYGTLGTLNLAHMAQRLADAPDSIVFLLAGLILIAFGSKASIFPLFFWLPASYHTPHPAVTALFGGILTKVGVYTLFRMFPLLFPQLLMDWQPLFLLIAGLTMTIGVLGAFAQPTIRRLLSFHIISQVGYMIMGLAIALNPSPYGVGFALAAAILFMAHNMLVKTALMMGGGVAELEMGSGSLSGIGGLIRRRPFLAGIFFVAAFSLAGIPPSSGFAGKLSLLEATLGVQSYWIAGVSIVVSLLTTMSMIRLWQYTFWGELKMGLTPTDPLNKRYSGWLVIAPITLLVALSLAMGIFFQPILNMATVAAQQVIDRDGYIAAVGPLDDIPATPSLWEAPQ
jgi:multicomponent Na+:H+ antiporter subunit D